MVPGDGRWNYQVVRRVTGGLDALLAAYDTADTSPATSGNVSCTLELPDQRVVWLHDDKGTTAVRAPHGICGKPTREGIEAYAAVTSTIVYEKKDQQSQSQLSIDSRCSDTYKDVMSLYEQAADRPNRKDKPAAVSGHVSVCTYTVDTDKEGDRIGHLTRQHVLTAEQVSDLNEGLSRVRYDRSCSRHEQTGFALVFGSGYDPLIVGLEGCAVSINDDWWRADDDVRRAVS